jgi:pimeloyl-ACP methyl ester carboxylesterase
MEKKLMPYVISKGVRTWYEVEGDGIPLVLHVGFFGNLEEWRRDDVRYTQALRDRYQLILVDPRGQGWSAAPHDPAAYTLAERAKDVLAVRDHLDIPKAHYWGYSMGGHVGLELAARSPDRLISLVAGGANPWWEYDPDDSGFILEWLQEGMAHFVTYWEREFGSLHESSRSHMLALDHEALAAAWIAPDRAEDLVNALPGMRLPALLYVGTNDNPEPYKHAVELMPDATLVTLEGLDHGQGFDRSDLVLPYVLRFLDRVDRARRGGIEGGSG